ncbi:Alpha/beta hydrolase fold-1 [Mycena maculata]|uniref:Alpha/beta hydrolase fold-1 n=1 Tax=Mycena maculata TaxID=230809 RepID=A0AAD7IN07_9AGAR|nr:Alpha/beta hydrolase fold-1 [Mycena maculata]
MLLHTTAAVFSCPPNRNGPVGLTLKMTAKRYCTAESASNEEGFSLLFAHCIGSHKEQWEPVIEHTFCVQQAKARHQRVREAWTFDWQNHGDAATLNHELLVNTRQMGVSAYEWGEAIAAFAVTPDMRGKRMVAIGHSAGTGAMMMSMRDFPTPAIPYVSVVLIEPIIATREIFYRHIADSTQTIVAAITMRRQRWRSRTEAYEWLKRRGPWKRWDARVLRIFVRYGLRDTSDGEVALKCDRRQEANAYPDVHPHFDAVDEIGRVCQSVPVHLVWANQSDFVPKIVQDSLSDVSEGRMVASITRLDGGHMIVQENPDRIALAICDSLDAVGVDLQIRARSRL